jgi:hypothetical protein
MSNPDRNRLVGKSILLPMTPGHREFCRGPAAYNIPASRATTASENLP